VSTGSVIHPRKGITTVPALITDAGDQVARRFLGDLLLTMQIDEEQLLGRLGGDDAGGAKLFRDALGDFEVNGHHDARSKSSSSHLAA